MPSDEYKEFCNIGTKSTDKCPVVVQFTCEVVYIDAAMMTCLLKRSTNVLHILPDDCWLTSNKAHKSQHFNFPHYQDFVQCLNVIKHLQACAV